MRDETDEHKIKLLREIHTQLLDIYATEQEAAAVLAGLLGEEPLRVLDAPTLYDSYKIAEFNPQEGPALAQARLCALSFELGGMPPYVAMYAYVRAHADPVLIVFDHREIDECLHYHAKVDVANAFREGHFDRFRAGDLLAILVWLKEGEDELVVEPLGYLKAR